MFGVTTSDDYRPVAWMGRYPVDVTTMLVGVHVVCAVLACILTAIPGVGGTLNYFVFDSARIWNGLQICDSAPTPLCISPPGCCGSRSRCTCCSYLGGKWSVLSGDALTLRST